MKQPITVVLIDDELRALNRMKILLKNFPNIKVLEQFADPVQGMEWIKTNQPDIAFIDIEMPDKTGIEIAEELNRTSVATVVIFITAYDHYAIEAIKTDAFDYLLKPVSINNLKMSLERFRARKHFNLGNREIEIINLLSDGFSSKKIGEQLNISHNTVDTYRRTVLEKTGCKNTAELIKYAVKINLI